MVKLEFFITVFYKSHQRTMHKYQSFLYPYLFSVEKPMHALNLHKVPLNKSLLCILTQTSSLHLPKHSFLIYKTEVIQMISEFLQALQFYKVNNSKCWLGFTFMTLRNLQYTMVWKVRISVFIKPSFEQISKICSTDQLQPETVYRYLLLIIMLMFIFIPFMS